MKIHFERTGGFMGLRMVATFDTAELPEEEATKIHELLDEIDFFELPAYLESPQSGMDQFQYVLTVSEETAAPDRNNHGFMMGDDDDEDGEPFPTFWGGGERHEESRTTPQEHTHTVTFSDAAAPLEMLPLLRMLTRMAHGE